MEVVDKENRLRNQLATHWGSGCTVDTDWPLDVVEVMRYVHAHLFDPCLNVGEALRQCGVGNHNASSRFKASVGFGPREYIERQRMEAAKLLLRTSDAEVYLIAEAIGYEYVESFTRAFHRSVGYTPGRYRERSKRALLQPSLFE